TPMLSACRPNPFSARTQISYQFPHDGPVNLQVYDASGRSVKTLQHGFQRAGKYTVTWDGRDASGRNVANGVYFYRFDAPGFRDVRKAVVMK
ncbi:MAG: T9SS type A sorting domain-containing protein, partial [candidate division WOR-3 bacterium]